MAKLGQHFLTDRQSLKKIAGLLDLKKNDVVLEIGPGHGELTEEIRNQKIENRIIAVEKDEWLAEELRKKFSGDKNIEIISGDALKLLPSIVQGPRFKVHGYKLVGNIPYYITGKLLRTVGELPKKPDVFVLTIQKEVAERLCARPKQMNSPHKKVTWGMNRLAASVQFWAKPEIVFILPKNYFSPAPEVDSATVVLKPAPTRKIAADAYYKVVRAVFSQPRKTILNNLSDGLKIPKKEIEAKLRGAGIQSNLRPQNLSLEDIFKLVSVFFGTPQN